MSSIDVAYCIKVRKYCVDIRYEYMQVHDEYVIHIGELCVYDVYVYVRMHVCMHVFIP